MRVALQLIAIVLCFVPLGRASSTATASYDPLDDAIDFAANNGFSIPAGWTVSWGHNSRMPHGHLAHTDYAAKSITISPRVSEAFGAHGFTLQEMVEFLGFLLVHESGHTDGPPNPNPLLDQCEHIQLYLDVQDELCMYIAEYKEGTGLIPWHLCGLHGDWAKVINNAAKGLNCPGPPTPKQFLCDACTE